MIGTLIASGNVAVGLGIGRMEKYMIVAIMVTSGSYSEAWAEAWFRTLSWSNAMPLSKVRPRGWSWDSSWSWTGSKAKSW
jgi:hypothetical protein